LIVGCHYFPPARPAK